MNTKFNKWFEQTATDPTRRHAAIADFTKRRAILFCCALVITAGALAMYFAGTRNSSSLILECFAAFMSWIVVIRIGSHLRILKLLEQFSGRDERPAA